MTSRTEMIAELERLDGELQRLGREIDVLRRNLDAPKSGRTQAFGAVPASAPPAVPASKPPAPTQRADTMAMPTPAPPAPTPAPPMPAPSRPVKTSTRTIPPSNGPRRMASPALDLDDAPATPGRRRDSPATPADMGRYGYVNEGKRPSSRR